MSRLQLRTSKIRKMTSKRIFDHFGVETPLAPQVVAIIDSMQANRFGEQYLIEREGLQITILTDITSEQDESFIV